MDLCACPVVELSRLIRAKTVSSEEVVQAHLDRIAAVNPQLTAVVQLRPDAALAEARRADQALAAGKNVGPLHGVPMTLKDSFDSRDLISTAGTIGRAQHLPAADATVLARLKKAGAILLGKSNTPELTIAYETDNLVYGRTVNPHDMSKSAGGSSGGAAAIVAAGGAPFDIGSDTGGSIRLPAHFCGIAGLKPTQGRVPRTGHIISCSGYLQALTHVGPLARTVDDLALLLPIISGPDGCDPHIVDAGFRADRDVDLRSLRIAFYHSIGDLKPQAEIAAKIEQVAQALSKTAAVVEQATPPRVTESYDLYYRLFHADGNAWVRDLLHAAGTETSHPFLAWAHKKHGAARSGQELAALLARWDGFRADMLAFMRQYDAMLCPVHPFAAFAPGCSKKTSYRDGFAFTMTSNLTGWPAAVVCAGKAADGLPIGVQVIAAPWREDTVLALARHIENAFGGWANNRPSLPSSAGRSDFLR